MAIKISGTTVIPDTLGSANQVLRINSGGTEGEWGDASGGVTYLSKTANYTASANEGILSDTSGGAFTVTLPVSPSEGDVVIINDAAGSWNTNNLTVERNGSTIDGDAENMTLDVDNASVEFIYDGATWGVYAGAGLVTSSATYDKTEFTATAGQTSFTVDYKVGFVDVYLNGVKLAASDYTATNETSVVLVEAAALNDIFEVIAWNVFSIADAVMDSELTDIAAVKALNQGVATTDSPTFAALSDGTDSVDTGYVVHGSAKVWVSFTPAAATVLDSFNVASLVDNGTGDTTVNFTNAMANGNYVQTSEAAFVYSGVALADMRCRLRSIPDRLSASTRLSTGDNDAVKNFTLTDYWSSATAIQGDLA
jgi:hypothetical protein